MPKIRYRVGKTKIIKYYEQVILFVGFFLNSRSNGIL